ncbi:hypothetical protein F3Y22_tig00111493pilonHSYRG00088 [Hibiscus syriacus]|uniref:Uncharacterized protein n=1 Tax=Hibiscus syriacus TaxID=106335 RepID=A0A6A2XQJ6_HIBSY|nr:hypothetical protein F3Y22_tig00111493pilonHSYRG00088 [Hibiscus syriacus]
MLNKRKTPITFLVTRTSSPLFIFSTTIPSSVFDEFGIGIYEQKIVVDHGLTWDDAEQVDQTLCNLTDMASNNVSTGRCVEDSEVYVGVGKAAMFVGTLAGAAERKTTINGGKFLSTDSSSPRRNGGTVSKRDSRYRDWEEGIGTWKRRKKY